MRKAQKIVLGALLGVALFLLCGFTVNAEVLPDEGIGDAAQAVVLQPAPPPEQPAPPPEQLAPPPEQPAPPPEQPAPPPEQPAPPVEEQPAPPVEEQPAPPVEEQPAPPAEEEPAPEQPAVPIAEEPAATPEDEEAEAVALALDGAGAPQEAEAPAPELPQVPQPNELDAPDAEPSLDPAVAAVQVITGQERFVPNLGWVFVRQADGSYVKGFVKLPDGRTVYYGDDYAMRFGAQGIGGMPYIFGGDGNLQNAGENRLPGGGWGYLSPDNAEYVTGLFKLPDGRIVYYGSDHLMHFGPMTLNGLPYNFSTGDGRLQNTGENRLPGGGWGYLSPDNAEYAKGFVKLPDGRTVYYGDDCAMRFGTQDIAGLPYIFNTVNGALQNYGENRLQNNGWGYLNPADNQYVRGFFKLPDNRTVYYDSNYRMLFGAQDFGGLPYIFSTVNGALQNYGENRLQNNGWGYLNPADNQYVKGFFTLPEPLVLL